VKKQKRVDSVFELDVVDDDFSKVNLNN
jgi:hypothetical protein